MFRNFIKSIKTLLFGFLIVIAFFVYFGYTYYTDSKDKARQSHEKNLQIIGKNKSNAITNWRNERFADSHFLYRNVILSRMLTSYQQTKSQRDSLDIVSSITTIYSGHDYFNIFILNQDKKKIVDLNPKINFDYNIDLLENAIERNNIIFSNIYFDSLLNSLTMDIYVPFHNKSQYISSIIFKIDPHQLLFPIVSSWFIENSSGESYIASVDTDSLSYLSPVKYLRFDKGIHRKSLNDLQFPLHNFLNKYGGVVQAIDYRNIEVIADVRPVENTPWFIITKIDLSEIYAPVYRDTFKNILILCAIVIIGGLALLVYYTKSNYKNLKTISEAERRFKDIFNNTKDAIVLLSGNKLIDCNPQAERLFGLSKKQLLNKTLPELSPLNQQDGSLSSEKISKQIASSLMDSSNNFDWTFLQGKNVIHTDVGLSNLVSNNKNITVVFIRDITGRVIAEDSNRKLSRAVEFSPLSIIITDSNGNIEYVNPAFTSLTGYTFAEVIGKNPSILSSGHSSASEYKILWHTIKSGNTWYGEFRNRKKNGDLFWEYASISPIKDSKNSISHFIAIKEDITDKKNRNEQLDLQSKMLNSIGQAVLAINLDSTVFYLNAPAEKLFGWTSSEIIGKNVIEIGVPESQVYEATQILSHLRKNKYWYGELIVKRKDNSQLPVLISASQVVSSSGVLIGFIGIFTDLTEIKNKEAELELAKENALEMNRLKNNFLANMSHELRTPLVGILGYAELLTEEIKNMPQRDMSLTILQSGRRLLDTLNSILDISRIEANKQNIIVSSVNLSQVLDESVKLFKLAAKEKSLELKHLLPEKTVFIKSDKELLLKIITNLISNSVKYTYEGSIVVSLSEISNGSQNSVIINVIDTGIGISSEFQNVIFEPFRQVSEGFSRLYEGAGLGLSITKKLVDLLKGEISFISEPGKGSTFSVKLPLNLEEAEAVVEEIYNANEEINPHNLSMNTEILLVEDDLSNAVIVETYLKEYVTLEHVYDGFEALIRCKRKRYDIILMDINLKGINGIETFNRIRLIDEYYADVPVIAITAYAMKGDKNKFLSLGFNDYISKPFERSQLIHILSSIYEETHNIKH